VTAHPRPGEAALFIRLFPRRDRFRPLAGDAFGQDLVNVLEDRLVGARLGEGR